MWQRENKGVIIYPSILTHFTRMFYIFIYVHNVLRPQGPSSGITIEINTKN